MAPILALSLLACGGKSAAGPEQGQAVAGARGVDTPPIVSTVGSDRGGGPDSDGSADGGESGDTSGAGATAGRAEPVTGGAPGSGGSAGSGGDPDAACLREACRLSVDPVPLWVTKVKGYGRGAAQLRFSDGGEVVRVGAGETDYYVSALNLVNGELVGEPAMTPWVAAVDSSGRRMVTAPDQCVVSVDGARTFAFPCGSMKAVRFSADGTVVTHQGCISDEGGVRLEAYDTESGELIARQDADLPCFYGDLNVLVDADHHRTLFGHPARSELFVFDWDRATIETRAIHELAPVSNHSPFNREGTILNVSLSPDGQHLVSVGAADGLAWLDLESLTVQARIPNVPFFNVYDNCYTTYLDESPVAWSPAGEIFATARPGGGVTLRDVATREPLALLDPPTDHEVIKSSCSSELGPVLMEFSPDMTRLAVLYPGNASVYALSGSTRH